MSKEEKKALKVEESTIKGNYFLYTLEINVNDSSPKKAFLVKYKIEEKYKIIRKEICSIDLFFLPNRGLREDFFMLNQCYIKI